MNPEKIAIITDSGSDVPADFVREHDVRVIPLQISYISKTYRSGVDISTDEVVANLEKELPTTSLPSPSAIADAINKCKEDGYTKALLVGISSGLSATYNTMQLVAKTVYGVTCEVIDTKSIGIAAGLSAMKAALMAEAGETFEKITSKLNELVKKTHVYFCVDNLNYLHQGGRISELQYRVGSVLNIKPIFDCDENGKYRIVKKCRGISKAMANIEDIVVEKAKDFKSATIAICSAQKDFDFASLKQRISDKAENISNIIESGISPDLIVHTGPTLFGMAIQEDIL